MTLAVIAFLRTILGILIMAVTPNSMQTLAVKLGWLAARDIAKAPMKRPPRRPLEDFIAERPDLFEGRETRRPRRIS